MSSGQYVQQYSAPPGQAFQTAGNTHDVAQVCICVFDVVTSCVFPTVWKACGGTQFSPRSCNCAVCICVFDVVEPACGGTSMWWKLEKTTVLQLCCVFCVFDDVVEPAQLQDRARFHHIEYTTSNTQNTQHNCKTVVFWIKLRTRVGDDAANNQEHHAETSGTVLRPRDVFTAR